MGGFISAAPIVLLDENDMASDSNEQASTQQAIKAFVEGIASGSSNLIWSYIGFDNYSSVTKKFHGDSGEVPNLSDEVGYDFIVVQNYSYDKIFDFKFKKTAGVNTITLFTRIWSSNAGSSREALLQVNIGGQSCVATSVASASPSWYEGATTIDVSGLTDGTVYDGVVNMRNEDIGYYSYTSAIYLIGS